MPLPSCHQPNVRPCGDAALIAEYGEAVDADINRRVLALDAYLTLHPLSGISEMVPTYRSLMVHYDPSVIGYSDLKSSLLAAAESSGSQTRQGRRWRIPVVYGGQFGADLSAIAARHNMSEAEVVRRHSAGVYRVYMLGFMPGFAYLGGLDPALATPRRDDPRLETPAGTVSIGGVQAGVQCLPAPSGWHLLGRTPVRTYHPDRQPIFLLEPGDEVIFYAIEARHFALLERRAEEGELIAEEAPK